MMINIQKYNQCSQNKRTAFFSICSSNYLPYARILFSSLLKYHPESDRFLILADHQHIDLEKESFQLIEAEDLPMPNFSSFAFRYDVTEFNTAIKPYAFLYLFRRQRYDAIIYLDPDIKVYHPLNKILPLRKGFSAAVTPHLTCPIEESEEPNDITMLRVGVFNLGFIALANKKPVIRFVNWWARRLEYTCYFNSLHEGFFVDQKWIDLLPCFVNKVLIIRDPGYNLAYWNLYHRTVAKKENHWYVNDSPLTFFHFSGVIPGNRKVFSKHQQRFHTENIGDVKVLLENYLDELVQHGVDDSKNWAYAYGQFANGEAVVTPMRYIFREELEPYQGDPFADNGKIFNEPDQRVKQDKNHLITRLMYRVWLQRKDLQSAFDITTVEGRDGFVRWYLATAEREIGISSAFIEPIRQRFFEVLKPSEDSLEIPIIRTAMIKTIKESFVSRILIHARIFRFLYKDLPIRFRQRIKSSLLAYAYRSKRSHYSSNVDFKFGVEQSENKNTFQRGVMLTGYAKAETGVGQGVRMHAKALRAASIDFGIFNIAAHHIFRQSDTSVEEYFQLENNFNINIFHINADQVFNLLTNLPDGFMDNRYNIGYWAWELSEFPQAWHTSFAPFDEIWVPSTFVQQSVSMSSDKPVIVMPHVIGRGKICSLDRSYFNISDKKVIFLCVFDYNSFLERKNPVAAIEAFKKEFSNHDNVGLVVKTHSGEHHQKQREKILGIIDNDVRIMYIDKVYTHEEIVALQNCCDVYISLHRSEGFGLNIAESMSLGKPVIVTNYSGNTDFTRVDNSCLVKSQLLPVKKGHYPFAEGQVWADPDIDQASWYMRRLVEDVEYRKLTGVKGKITMDGYSAISIGNRIRKRLARLGLISEVHQ